MLPNTAVKSPDASANVERSKLATVPPARRAAQLCVIVHDAMELRLRLAMLVRRASPALDADTMDRAAFAALTIDRLGAYIAALFIIDFSAAAAGEDPLAIVAHLRDRAPQLPIVVFGCGGDERSAARSIKRGALDYWPIHSVKADELGELLTPLVETANRAKMSPAAPVERRGQPQIAGYSLTKKIAQSAAATVYLAHSDELARPVALKVHALEGLRPGSESDQKRFAAECKILSALNHRSIADVLDFGITDEFLYLALEYFACGSLRERLRNPVREADALNYVQQVGEALQVVHAARIVHGDLKPSNVMLTDSNRVVLIDFGSACSQLVARDLARSDISTGTPYYVCPEQIAGRAPDARSDLYSLGVMLYEMLVGALPFAGKTLAEIFTAHQSAPTPRLPAPLARYQPLLDRLLAKDPADRYGSAAAFLEALNKLTTPGSPGPTAPAATSNGASDS